MKYKLIEKNTLSRLNTHMENGFICISASRGNLSAKENKQRTQELKKELEMFQFGYWQTKGGYVEEPKSEVFDEVGIEVFEDSFLVPYSDTYGDFGSFENTMASMGNLYEQDAILVKPQGKSKPAYFLYLDQSKESGKTETLGANISVSQAVQYFTQLKNGKRFVVAESKQGFALYYGSPSSAFEAQSFALRKQLWLAEGANNGNN